MESYKGDQYERKFSVAFTEPTALAEVLLLVPDSISSSNEDRVYAVVKENYSAYEWLTDHSWKVECTSTSGWAGASKRYHCQDENGEPVLATGVRLENNSGILVSEMRVYSTSRLSIPAEHVIGGNSRFAD